MNILILDSVSFLGGGQKVAIDAAFALKKAGHNILFSIPEEGQFSKALDINTIPYIFSKPNRNYSNLFGILLLQLQSFRILQNQIGVTKTDLIYINSSRSLLLGLSLCVKLKIKAIFYLHLIYKNKIFLFLISLLSLSPCINTLVCVSNTVKAQLPSFIKQKALVIYNCLDFSGYQKNAEIREKTRKKLSVQNNEFLIGAFGAIKKEKNYMTVLRALRRLTEENIDNVKCLFIGNVENKQYKTDLINYAIQNNLTDKVIILDYKQNLIDYYQALDIYSVNSTESFSLVLLEALAIGLPTVISEGSGPEEIVKLISTGYLYEQGNEKELSQVINKIIYEIYIINNRQQDIKRKLENTFSPLSFSKKIIQLIKQI